MIICVCKCVTDSEIKSEVASGTTSYEGLQCSLGVGTQCGSCSCEIKDILQSMKAKAASCQHKEPLGKMPKPYSSENEMLKPLGSNL